MIVQKDGALNARVCGCSRDLTASKLEPAQPKLGAGKDENLINLCGLSVSIAHSVALACYI